MFCFSKLNVNITHHVVSQVVTNVQAFYLSIFVQLLKQVFIEILKVGLDFAGVNGLALRIDARGDHIGALVHVGED